MTSGGRGVKKLEIWGNVIYGWSLGEIECPKFIPPFFVRSFTDIFPKSVDRNSVSIKNFCTNLMKIL